MLSETAVMLTGVAEMWPWEVGRVLICSDLIPVGGADPLIWGGD